MRHCATSRKVVGSMSDGVTGMFHCYNPSGRTMAPGVDSVSNRSECQEYFLWGKAAGMGRDNAVGKATRYGLDGPGIESRWGARFSAPVQTGPGAHPASCTLGTGSLSGVKRPGRDDHPSQSSVKAKERVELYLYSPSGPSRPVIG